MIKDETRLAALASNSKMCLFPTTFGPTFPLLPCTPNCTTFRGSARHKIVYMTNVWGVGADTRYVKSHLRGELPYSLTLFLPVRNEGERMAVELTKPRHSSSISLTFHI